MQSDAVKLQDIGSSILLLTMQDRAHKNTFSADLVKGLAAAFEYVRREQRYRALVLTGYDTYFCSGGTQESLLNLHEGIGRFTDTDVYSLPLVCEIPVVAAMQGHAIGGGLVFGLFADCVVFSRESIYTTNFMKYGFTPGMGATLVLPRKLGLPLAEELLLSARTYRGADLEKRGMPFPVLPRAEVLDYALQLATDLADKPRVSLVTLKNHLVKELRAQLPQVASEEVRMHEKTFHLPEVKQRIQREFGQ